MMIKTLTAALFAFFIYQAWTNIQDSNLMTEKQNANYFQPIKLYIADYINQNEKLPPNIQFSKMTTKTITPGREIEGRFSLNYDQNKDIKELATKAYFEGIVRLTSFNGDNWTAKIKELKNVRQDFVDPMVIKAGQ